MNIENLVIHVIQQSFHSFHQLRLHHVHIGHGAQSTVELTQGCRFCAPGPVDKFMKIGNAPVNTSKCMLVLQSHSPAQSDPGIKLFSLLSPPTWNETRHRVHNQQFRKRWSISSKFNFLPCSSNFPGWGHHKFQSNTMALTMGQ